MLGDSYADIRSCRGGNKPMKLSDEVLTLIEQTYERNDGITMKLLAVTLRRDHNVAISTSTVANGLRKLKITTTATTAPVDASQSDSQRTRRLRAAFVQEITGWTALRSCDSIVFVAECVFHFHQQRVMASHATRSTVMVLVGLTTAGVLHTKLLKHNKPHNTRVANFLHEIVDIVRGTSLECGLLVLDAASTAPTTTVQAELLSNTEQNSQMRMQFIPQHSPTLNPVAKFGAEMKASARQLCEADASKDDLMVILEESLSAVLGRSIGGDYVQDVMRELASWQTPF